MFESRRGERLLRGTGPRPGPWEEEKHTNAGAPVEAISKEAGPPQESTTNFDPAAVVNPRSRKPTRHELSETLACAVAGLVGPGLGRAGAKTGWSAGARCGP